MLAAKTAALPKDWPRPTTLANLLKRPQIVPRDNAHHKWFDLVFTVAAKTMPEAKIAAAALKKDSRPPA